MEPDVDQAADERFLLDFFKALADPLRLRIAGRLAAGPATRSAIAAELGVAPRDCVRQLARLVEFGLVREQIDRGVTKYQLDEQWLREHSAALLDSPRSRELAGATDEPSRVLAAFMRDGKLTAIPAGDRRKLVILDLLARRFEADRTYAEREVNEIIKEVYERDYTTLRRALVDFHFLNRDQGVYWVGQGRRDPEAAPASGDADSTESG